MIKFFRHIRQSLINQNRMGKYFKYAIGEIILVMIGILLALQVNNWNENNKTELDLNNSLHAMVKELNENLKFIQNHKKSNQNRINGIQNIFNASLSLEEQKDIINIFGENARSRPFNKTYELLKGEKKLQLIKDKSLIIRIRNFYEYDLKNIDEFCNWHQDFVGDNIDPYILENIPLENDEVDPKTLSSLLKDVKFRNILTYQKRLYGSYVESSERAITGAQNLIAKIEYYLTKNND